MTTDNTNNNGKRTESENSAAPHHVETFTGDDRNGIYRDGYGTYLRVVENASGKVSIYTGVPHEATVDEHPREMYDSFEEFEQENPDAIPIPNRAIQNPKSIAERVYDIGFEDAVSMGYSINDEAVLYADGVTKVVEVNK